VHTMRIPFPVPPWPARLAELRIGVAQSPSDIEQQLAPLYRRLIRPGDALHDLPVLCIQIPGFVLRYREADGEHYVYVEDKARGRLAGCVVDRPTERNLDTRMVMLGRGSDLDRLSEATGMRLEADADAEQPVRQRLFRRRP
jgi:hypothetical protein